MANIGMLGNALNLPIMQALKQVDRTTQPATKARIQACLPVVAELERTIDPIINGMGLTALLAAGRVVNPKFPNAQTVRDRFQSFKRKMRADPAFTRLVCDVLPSLAGRYDAGSAFQIVTDPDFMRLLEEAAK